MPSVLSGYTYDIFISYRQNDNRSGWVTEFVKALQEELAATIKDPVSVYFDSNPHDGLLETHNVDKSLESKLKCLIFIPVISQTYCDTKSFAWQHEFCAFNKLAKSDAFGLDVKLENGNVANRILPIKIHELDGEDKALLETELGGPLRALELMFRSPGVNRPLTANDRREDNLSKTIYKDQISKVGSSIKELVRAMKSPHHKNADGTTKLKPEVKQRIKLSRKMVMAVVLLAATATASYLWLMPQAPKANESSVAVIPLHNFTGSDSMNTFGIGVAMEVGSRLGLSKQFKYISSMQATLKYQNTNESPSTIGKTLGVSHLLSGIYQKAGNDIQVTLEFIETETGEVLWNIKHHTRYDDIFKLQDDVASAIQKRFALTAQENSTAVRPSASVAAYYHYLEGYRLSNSTISHRLKAIPELQKAIQLDSTFIEPFQQLVTTYGFVYVNLVDSSVTLKTIEPYVRIVERRFPDSPKKKYFQGAYQYFFLQDLDKALELFNQILADDPGNSMTNTLAASILRRKLMLSEALVCALKGIRESPTTAPTWNEIYAVLTWNGDIDNSRKAAWKFYENNNGPYTVYWWHERERMLEKLPDDVKKFVGAEYQADLLLQRKEYGNLLDFADTARFADGKSTNHYYRALSFYLLGKDKEANQECGAYVKSVKTYVPVALLRLNTNKSLVIYSILKKEREQRDLIALTYLRRYSKQDLQTKFEREAWDFLYSALSGNYPEATAKLRKLNLGYPAIGSYSWINHPAFDRIKREYPPFLQALDQLVYPPKLLEGKEVDW